MSIMNCDTRRFAPQVNSPNGGVSGDTLFYTDGAGVWWSVQRSSQL